MSKATLRKSMQARSAPVAEPSRPRWRYTPPSDEQLENFVLAETERLNPSVLGMTPMRAFVIKEALRIPAVRQRWLRALRELQETVWAEEQRRRG